MWNFSLLIPGLPLPRLHTNQTLTVYVIKKNGAVLISVMWGYRCGADTHHQHHETQNTSMPSPPPHLTQTLPLRHNNPSYLHTIVSNTTLSEALSYFYQCKHSVSIINHIKPKTLLNKREREKKTVGASVVASCVRLCTRFIYFFF